MRAMWMGLGGFFLCAVTAATARADLDVAFVLDTTGSMDGELREAKERVTQIADALVAGRPEERVRLAVVAFRDRGDDYVTRHSELSPDVADAHAFLATLEAGGGGDGPEDVLSGLWVALDALDWGPTPGTDRELFLIGDAPPHLDYEGHVTPERLVERARAGRHVIHAIGCRSLSSGGVDFFRQVAFATEGSYQHIGAVRLGGDAPEGGLAGAVLDALAARPKRRLPALPLRWSSAPADGAPGLRVTLAPRADGCRLEVQTPRGSGLSGTPRVGRDPDAAVEVRLGLVQGRAERAWAALPDCDARATVHVQLEVE